jgi:hypothetical protein
VLAHRVHVARDIQLGVRDRLITIGYVEGLHDVVADAEQSVPVQQCAACVADLAVLVLGEAAPVAAEVDSLEQLTSETKSLP